MQQPSNLQQRVIRAAEAVLEAKGAVGPLEVLEQMALLAASHVQTWRKGLYDCLEPHLQGSPDKLAKVYAFFAQWVKDKKLEPVEATYWRAGVKGNESLRVTQTGDPVREQFFRTHYTPAHQPARKAKQIKAKLNQAPDLVVFQTVSASVICSECKLEMTKGDLLTLEKGQPLCLGCADLDYLEFLPRGDAALSRRARKYSRLSAIVVRFSRSRHRYERQGILVTPEAIAQAEQECLADAEVREARRIQDATKRQYEDQQLVAAMTQMIHHRYPGCPAREAETIARHTAERGSGRVGRSAAGRELDPRAIELAVIAYIRHRHTDYDTMLMQGTDRQDARTLVRPNIERVLEQWSAL